MKEYKCYKCGEVTDDPAFAILILDDLVTPILEDDAGMHEVSLCRFCCKQVGVIYIVETETARQKSAQPLSDTVRE